MTESVERIYVVARDGGCEGYSLPFLAFKDREKALLWCKSQNDQFAVATVPIFPDLPEDQWFKIKPVEP